MSGLGYPVGWVHPPQSRLPPLTIPLGLSEPAEPHKQVCQFVCAVVAGPTVVGNLVRGSRV